MRKPDTVEIRMLDTPSLFSYYVFIIKYLFALGERIKDNNPMVECLTKKDWRDTESKLRLSRDLLVNQRYGVNKIFRKLNTEVCEDTSKFFGIDFPRQTQFEFREAKGLSADVNGYLSMATMGGWL
jgi:hypothetical protein